MLVIRDAPGKRMRIRGLHDLTERRHHRPELATNYNDDDDAAAEAANRPAYHATHRDMHAAWTFAHPKRRGLSIVHRTWVIILIPIAPLCALYFCVVCYSYFPGA